MQVCQPTKKNTNSSDTFDLQSNANISGSLHPRHAEPGFGGLGDEEDDMYEEDNEDDDDDGDALSSSPSIPDDVSLPYCTYLFQLTCLRILISTLCMHYIRSQQLWKDRQMRQKGTCSYC